MKPAFRCGTKKAIDELAEELSLPNDEWMQDWPYEVVIPSDIEKYISHYNGLTDDDKKFVLTEGIIQSIEDQASDELFNQYWNIVRPILNAGFKIHEYTIYYWSCFDNENIEDCWNITQPMRQLWEEHNNEP